MKGDDISERLVDVAARVIKVVDALPQSIAGRHIADQLVRSATGAGANYEEARGAESRRDFVHKLGLALKELQEGGYVACEVEPVSGRQRKVCSLTARGEQAYVAAAKAWMNFLPHLVVCITRAPGMSGRAFMVLSDCCEDAIPSGEKQQGS